MEGLQSQRCSSIAVPRKKTWSKSLTWLVHRVSIISIFNLVPRFLVDYIMSLVNQLKRSSDRSFFGEHPRFAMPSDWVNPSDCYSRDFSWRWLVQGFGIHFFLWLVKWYLIFKGILATPFPPRNNGLIRQVSHYLHGLYIPGGAGFLPSTALKETLVVNNSIFLHPCCLVGVVL